MAVVRKGRATAPAQVERPRKATPDDLKRMFGGAVRYVPKED